MFKKRRKMSKGKSKRYFKAASGSKGINFKVKPKRGGIRL